MSCWSWYLEGWGPFCIATQGSSRTEKPWKKLRKSLQSDSTPVLRSLLCFLLVNVGQFFSQALSYIFLEPFEAATVFAGSWKKSKFKEATISASRGFGRGVSSAHGLWFRFVGFYRQEKTKDWLEEAPSCSGFRLIQPNSNSTEKCSTNVLHSSGVRLVFQN